jgi:hypothetical protein
VAVSDPLPERVGLCARCAHAAVQRSARGSEFWRCRRADVDPTLARYPPLPVRACHAFIPGEPERPELRSN